MSINNRSPLSIEATAGNLEKLVGALSNSHKYILMTSIDVGLFLVSIGTAIGFARGFDRIPLEIGDRGNLVLLSVVVKIGLFWSFGIYRQILRYMGWEFLFATVKAVTLSAIVVGLAANLLPNITVPYSIVINDAILTLLLVMCSRLTIKLTLEEVRRINRPVKDTTHRVVIYGAGSAGCLLAQAIAADSPECTIGFVDDSPYLQGRNVQGIKVYSPSDLPALKAEIGFKEILLAMPSIEGKRKREILEQLQGLSLLVKTVPSINEILSGDVSVKKVRELNIEDLLGRKPIAPHPELLQHDITNRVVLVTGAGGSIGAELCRQIAKQQPKILIVYELHEFALYRIELELEEHFPDLLIVPCLGSVTDAEGLSSVLKKYRVDTIYHAAAYKHVPIVEANPPAGVMNNIGGTMIAAECAIAAGVSKFVLISTDKAVRPTNVMGATKRVAELVLQGLADLPTHNTCFTMVRFGNVLGSSGSVVPRFREQIVAGKSLTVTHKDITRYFMTIPEAATLVIQAGAMAKGGEVFLLEMGEPVKIYDLATQVIRLFGLEPGKDVKIEITGLRPGEKIYEELLIDCNGAIPTGHAKIFSAHEAKLTWTELSPQLNNLLTAASLGRVQECVKALHQLVPEYQPMGEYAISEFAPLKVKLAAEIS
jgi:FlaA1/EpsC-like NDP-sugar epimerase